MLHAKNGGTVNTGREQQRLFNIGSLVRQTSLQWLKQTRSRWQRWSINFDTRKQLLHLDEHELRDIGMTREDAITEGRKAFWRE